MHRKLNSNIFIEGQLTPICVFRRDLAMAPLGQKKIKNSRIGKNRKTWNALL